MQRVWSSVLLSLVILLTACEPEHKPFDKQAWAKGDYRDRGRMYLDLQQRHPLKGLSVEDVKSLISEPNDVDTTKGILTWYLDLGYTGLFHMDLRIAAPAQRVDSVRVWD